MKRIIIVCFALASFGQAYSQQSADKALQYLNENFSQENIYVLTDKDLYLSGETVWFNAMVQRNFTISDISTNFFIELYDRNKKQILRKRFPIFNGSAQGSFQLPENLNEDIYFVRAYTPMMSNLSEDFQYLKQIPVYNPSSPKKLVKDKTSSWSVTLHPEGNTLIQGNQSKIAVRLHSKGTPPSQWEGYVIEKDHPEKKISTFKGLDGNVGIFSFTPEKDKIYEAVVTDNNGLQKSATLPKASETGVSLQVISEKDNIKYKIKNSGEAYPYLTVIANIGEQVVYKAKVNQLKDAFQSIPTNQLINSVLQITVFDDKENPLVSRICFVMPQDLHIAVPEVKPQTLSTERRALNSFDIKPLKDVMNYSVAVFDPEYKKSLQDENFLSSLWLTSVIKSKIDRPAQYFSGKINPEALDALLISERWKMFDWKEIISGKYPSIINNSSKYISYKGKVTINAKPAAQQTLIMFVEGNKSDREILQAETDSNGEFFFDNMIFEKPIKITYQLNGANASLKSRTNVFINPANTFIPLKKDLPEIEGYQLVERTTSSETSQPIELTKIIEAKKSKKEYDEKIVNIEEVKIKAKRKNLTEDLNKKLSSPLYRSMNEVVFDFVNDNQSAASSPNILQWLQGRVAGLTINNENGNPTPYIRQGKANIYLDEMLVDANALSGIPVANIAMVKVIKEGGLGMSGGGNGGVLIYTKRGDTQTPVENKLSNMIDLNFFVMEGYNESEEYPDSDYGNSELSKISTDYRPVLFWNPVFEIDETSPAIINFYNNDSAKKYRFIIMGFDAEKYIPVYYDKVIP